jgi:hypothetical protein
MGWLVQILLLLAGVVAGWFVPHGEIGSSVIQFVVVLIMVFMFALMVFYFPTVRDFVRRPPSQGLDD